MYIEKHYIQTNGQTANWENICDKIDRHPQYKRSHEKCV